MRQSAFTILTYIKGAEVGNLETLLNEIGANVTGSPLLHFPQFGNLHYASLFIVEGGTGDPYLVFEGNVDGPADRFLLHMLQISPDGLDAIYRHCEGYPTGGARDRAAALGYLKAHDMGANTFYINRPGLTVKDIRQEQELRDHIERFLEDHGESGFRGRSPETIRQSIGAALPAEISWARTAAPTPFLVKKAKLVIFLIVALPVLSLIRLVKAALGWASTRPRAFLARATLLSILGLVAGAVRRLRAEENNDERKDGERYPDWQTAYARWTSNETALGRAEDRLPQNHMVSITDIKPGWFRLTVLRVVLWVINLLARIWYNKGSLGGITSIHFARWVITPDRRLLFVSNFDGSWESYLNDFIDQAAVGLTAIWSNTETGVGYPATTWLVRGGARKADRFKAYARSSMVPTNVWYSAYPDISAPNIGNNQEIRDGLFGPPDPATTAAWFRRL